MRKAKIFIDGIFAGVLIHNTSRYKFEYLDNYVGQPLSLTMTDLQGKYEFDTFPPFFDGLLPEGRQLEILLKESKIDNNDYFSQLIAVGADVVGNITIEEYN